MGSDVGTGYNSIPDAQEVLRRIACAREIRRIADDESERHDDAERRTTLYTAADYIERSGPWGGLLTIGVITEDIHPDDIVWLLEECVEGRNSGAFPEGTPGLVWDARIRVRRWLDDDEFEWVARSNVDDAR